MIDKYINVLLKEIKKSLKENEVPVAALLVDENGKILSKAHNNREKKFKTINHAEIICIDKANKRMKNKILNNCNMYVTLEPCDMCKSVIKEARIKNVYYLLSRNPQKKQYSKTTFNIINNNFDFISYYQNLLTNFFKKRR